MFYFSSDEKVQGPGFDVIVQQHSCDESLNSFENRIHEENEHSRPPFAASPSRPLDFDASSRPAVSSACDQWITNERDVISSPSYPSDYLPGSRCQYTISRSSSDVCQVRLRFISFDLEPTPNCSIDYFFVESTNERLCHPSMTASEKTLTLPTGSGQIRMFFKADSRVSRTGFKILVEQIRNSCSRLTTSSPLMPTLPISPWSSPASGGTRDNVQPRICNYSSASFLIISSENYPNPYRSSTDCVYRINRRDSRVCGLEIFFSDFSVGTWESDRSQQLCVNDYVKIGNQYFCGYRKNERIVQSFLPGVDYIDIRFFTDAMVNYRGFVMEVRQVDTCRVGIPVSPVATFRGGRKVPLDRPIMQNTGDIVHTTVTASMGTSTPVPTGGPFCGAKTFKEESFEILSPGYNDRGKYEPWTDCHYTVKKIHFTVCALEVRFNIMSLEDEDGGRQCSADFLQFGADVKVCGKLSKPTTRK